MKGFVVLIFLLNPISSWGLTQNELINSVITHFPLIDAAEMKANSSEGDVTAAKGAFDHKLKFKTKLWRQYPYNNEYYETMVERQTPWGGAKILAGHRQGAGNFNYYDLNNDTSTAGQIFAGIAMPLLRNLMTDEYRTNLRQSEIKNKQAEQEVSLKKLIYVHKSLSTYYKWVLAIKELSIRKNLLALAEKRQDMILRKFKAGDETQLKVTDNERQINKRQSEIIKAEVDLQKTATELSLFWRNKEGKPQIPPPIANPDEILLNFEAFGFDKKKENPQVKILSFENELNRLEYELNEQARLPGLNVDVTGGRELSNRPGYGEHILQVGVQFDFPLENRKASGKTVAFYYKKKAIEKELTYIRQQLSQQIQYSTQASSGSRRRYEVTNREFENSTKVAEGERKKWAMGSSDLFVVNLREQDVADVDIRRWSALYDYHQYHLDALLFSANLPIE